MSIFSAVSVRNTVLFGTLTIPVGIILLPISLPIFLGVKLYDKIKGH